MEVYGPQCLDVVWCTLTVLWGGKISAKKVSSADDGGLGSIWQWLLCSGGIIAGLFCPAALWCKPPEPKWASDLRFPRARLMLVSHHACLLHFKNWKWERNELLPVYIEEYNSIDRFLIRNHRNTGQNRFWERTVNRGFSALRNKRETKRKLDGQKPKTKQNKAKNHFQQTELKKMAKGFGGGRKR